MANLKAILIDDELKALEGLQLKIARFFPEIEIVATISDAEEAVSIIQDKKPNLVFIDIEMPILSGFDVLSKLEKIDFQVIFVTAYNQYAVEAFKKDAIDYLLKPIDNDDLKKAIHKAIKMITVQEEHQNNQKLINFLSSEIAQKNKLVVPTVKGVSFINQNEILFLEGYQGYTKIHLNSSEIVSSYSLGKFEKQLNNQFFKCHKSYIVNLNHIKQFENEGYLILTNNFRLPISRINRKPFLSIFDK